MMLCSRPTAGSPWFKVRRVSKEDYKEALERNRTQEAGGDDGKLSPKDKIDSAW
jgi:ATP-dependent Clp protease protease subunit